MTTDTVQHPPHLHRGLAVLLLVVVVLSACGPAGQQATGPSPTSTGDEATPTRGRGSPTGAGAGAGGGEEATSLTVAPAAPVLPFLPVAVARHQGFFAQHGLEVELVQARGADAVAAVQSGQVDFVLTLPELIIRTRPQGSTLTIVGTTVNTNLFSLYADQQVKGLADLAGRKVGIHVEGNGPDLQLRWLLDEHGAGHDQSTFVATGPPPAGIAAMKQGQIAARMFPPEFGVQLKREGLTRLVEMRQYIKDYAFGVMAATADTLETRPEAVRGFVAAMAEAARFITDNPQAAIEAGADFTGRPQEVVAQAFTQMKGAYARDAAAPEGALEQSMDLMVRYGVLADPLPVGEVYDPSFLPGA